jgi:hypothetical protein
VQSNWQDSQHNIQTRSRYRCCGKAVLHICVCVWARVRAYARVRACVHVALLVQHSTRMRHILTSFVAPLAPPHFSTLSHKRHDFRKTLLNIKCVSWLSLEFLSKTFLILRRIQRDIVITVKRLYVTYPLFLSDFIETWIFWTDFRKKLKYQVLSQSVQWRAEFLHADGQTDGRTDGHDKVNSCCSKFCERAQQQFLQKFTSKAWKFLFIALNFTHKPSASRNYMGRF